MEYRENSNLTSINEDSEGNEAQIISNNFKKQSRKEIDHTSQSPKFNDSPRHLYQNQVKHTNRIQPLHVLRNQAHGPFMENNGQNDLISSDPARLRNNIQLKHIVKDKRMSLDQTIHRRRKDISRGSSIGDETEAGITFHGTMINENERSQNSVNGEEIMYGKQRQKYMQIDPIVPIDLVQASGENEPVESELTIIQSRKENRDQSPQSIRLRSPLQNQNVSQLHLTHINEVSEDNMFVHDYDQTNSSVNIINKLDQSAFNRIETLESQKSKNSSRYQRQKEQSVVVVRDSNQFFVNSTLGTGRTNTNMSARHPLINKRSTQANQRHAGGDISSKSGSNRASSRSTGRRSDKIRRRSRKSIQSRAILKYDDSSSQDEEDGLQVNKFIRSLTSTTVDGSQPNIKFKNFSDHFEKLTSKVRVTTDQPILHCMISHDSRTVVLSTMKNDQEYHINMYSTKSHQLIFTEKFGGHYDSYIKLKEIEQNFDGTYFAVAYYDNYQFKLRTFDKWKKRRTDQEIEDDELNISKKLNLNKLQKTIVNFPEPFIVCTFVTDETLYVNLFDSHGLDYHHFFYNINTKKVHHHLSLRLECNQKNYPQKCFYDPENNEVYTFYRQGQSMRTPVKFIDHPQNKNKNDLYYQHISQSSLGLMYLIYNKVLAARSSDKIVFFKLEIDKYTGEKVWMLYHTIYVRGFIYFMKGNRMFQITTDQKIYFYKIDPIDLMPELEIVMYNYMNCTQMMFGPSVQYCLTFKINQRSFDIYSRMYQHGFCINVVEDNLEGSQGLHIESLNLLLVSNKDTIRLYNTDDYQELANCDIKIELMDGEKDQESSEIISMQVTPHQTTLIVFTGKHMRLGKKVMNHMFIFNQHKDDSGTDDSELESFEFVCTKKIDLSENELIQNICQQFVFKIDNAEPEEKKKYHTVLFAKEDMLIEYNYESEKISEYYNYQTHLEQTPNIFVLNDSQTVFTVCSQYDAIYCDMKTKKTWDLQELFQINCVKNVFYDSEDHTFYIVANKYHNKLGFFIVRFSEQDPEKHNFVMKIKNKLDIADSSIVLLRDKKKNYKELIISYKTIYMNVYNVQVIDISKPERNFVLFRHESFQMWESKINCIFLQNNRSFITLNDEGLNVMSLDYVSRFPITADNGSKKMCHSLESTNHLRIDPNNFILYEFASETKVISVQQQYTKEDQNSGGDQTEFETIYKIRIHDISLRELLFFQSMYYTRQVKDVLNIVQEQPQPSIFYKSYLELDCSNLVSILSFDSRSMKHLLDDSNKSMFEKDFPIFYKQKLQKSNKKEKYFYRSAIDIALRNNQIRAVSLIIEYVVKYQNNYVSSFLFIKTLPLLVQKGVEISSLLNSNIFCFQFDYDGWPSSHTNNKMYMRAYNGSLFNLRHNYRKIFHEEEFEMKELSDQVYDTRKLYKVTYTINMLPKFGQYAQKDPKTGEINIENENASLMKVFNNSSELEIFESQNFQDFIQYRWNNFSLQVHMIGLLVHLSYFLYFLLYIKIIYIDYNLEHKEQMTYGFIIPIMLPFIYETIQLFKTGPIEYFSDVENVSDIVYIWGTIANIIIQTNGLLDHSSSINKILMIIIWITLLMKTLFFMKMFSSISYIVTMIQTVLLDLVVFILYYLILILFFAMMYAIIGVGNKKAPGRFQDAFQHLDFDENGVDVPNIEFDKIGLFLGYICMVFRDSLGEFEFAASTYLDSVENYIYWTVWLSSILMTTFISLNFIIAETSQSYRKVKKRIAAQINKQKASLIAESEDIVFRSLKNEKRFPKYIIIRQIDQ